MIKIKNNTIKIYKINNYKKYEFTVNYIEKFEKIPNLDFVRLTFVVQDNNYKEMVGFIELADCLQKLNGLKTEVNFIHINNWGTFTEGQFKIKNVKDVNHPEHKMFLVELEKLKLLRNQYKNLQIFTNS